MAPRCNVTAEWMEEMVRHMAKEEKRLLVSRNYFANELAHRINQEDHQHLSRGSRRTTAVIKQARKDDKAEMESEKADGERAGKELEQRERREQGNDARRVRAEAAAVRGGRSAREEEPQDEEPQDEEPEDEDDADGFPQTSN